MKYLDWRAKGGSREALGMNLERGYIISWRASQVAYACARQALAWQLYYVYLGWQTAPRGLIFRRAFNAPLNLGERARGARERFEETRTQSMRKSACWELRSLEAGGERKRAVPRVRRKSNISAIELASEAGCWEANELIESPLCAFSSRGRRKRKGRDVVINWRVNAKIDSFRLNLVLRIYRPVLRWHENLR